MTAPKLGLGGCMRPKTQWLRWLLLLLAVGCPAENSQLTIPRGSATLSKVNLMLGPIWTAWMIWMWMYSGCESFCRHVHVYKTPTEKRDIGKNCESKGIFGGSSQPPAMRMMKLPLQPDSHGGPDSWGREIFSARTLSFTDWQILVEIWR